MIEFLFGLFIGLMFYWNEKHLRKRIEKCQKEDKADIDFWKKMYYKK